MFRDLEAAKTPLAEEAAQFVQRGEYVPDEITDQLVRERLGKADAQRGFILDGYPRTLEQAIALDETLAAQGKRVDAAVDIEVPEEVLVQRLRHRRAIEHREDDDPHVVGHRFATYRDQTEPVIAYYAKQGKLLTVDGAGSLDDVTEEIEQALGISSRPSQEPA